MLRNKKILYLIVFLGVFLFYMDSALAQCAMCKITAENSIVEGKSGIALGLNTGILYLASFPYLIGSVILALLYTHYKKKKKFESRESAGEMVD